MKKAILFIYTCLCFIFGYAEQNKSEVGLNIGKDCVVYHLWAGGYYDEDNDFSPRTINIQVTSSINNIIKVGIKSGYSFRTNQQSYKSLSNDESYRYGYELKGGYFQVLGLVNSSLTEKISIFIGAGGGFNYYASNYFHSTNYFTSQRYTTIGFSQTFLFGGSFRISEKITLPLTFEKLGFENLRYQYDAYNNEGKKVGEHTLDYQPKSGFDDVGITMGIVFSL